MRTLALFSMLTFASLVVLPACEDSSRPGPFGPPVVGSLSITTSTTGENIDSDGYSCTLDGGPPAVMGVNATAVLTGLSAGPHLVRLSGIAENCRVSDSDPGWTTGAANPRWIDVAAGEMAKTTFAIVCAG